MTQHILSLSYGKDSLACLGAIEQLGWTLDRIVHAEVWATDTIPADLPMMVEFKAKADEIIKKRWGIEVEHVCAMDGEKKRTYESVFYRKRLSSKNGNKIHKIYGWPFQKGPWCNDRLKTSVLEKVNRQGVIYSGIAADEPERISRWTGRLSMPLVEAGWTEAMCRKWCEENDLLSPIYTTATRGGCWFCHNQSVKQLRLLRKNHPELWALMLKWDADSPVTFTSSGRTLRDYDLRFKLEDLGAVPIGGKFRWADVAKRKQIPGQISIEEVPCQ
jgi:hypothetical protein